MRSGGDKYVPRPNWGMSTVVVVARGSVASMLLLGVAIVDRTTVVDPESLVFFVVPLFGGFFLSGFPGGSPSRLSNKKIESCIRVFRESNFPMECFCSFPNYVTPQVIS